MSGTSFISAQPQQQPFPDVVGGFLQARDNALAYRTNTFNLDALQQKQAQEQQINALAPRILAGDQAAYEQAIAINPAYAQGIQTARGQFEQTGANTAHINAVTGEMPTRLGIAVNQDQRAQQEAIAKMNAEQRKIALDNIDIMARIGGSLMSTHPDTASRTAAWPAARADIMRLTGNDPGEAYPGDARVQQFLTQAQSAPDLFKQQNSTYANPWATPGAATTASAVPGAVPSPAANPVVQGGAPIIGTRNPISPPSMDSGAAPAPPVAPPNALQPRPQAAALAPAQSPQVAQLQSMATEIATRNQVPPSLVHSMVGAESGWNPNARSRAGAGGLMQLMGPTAAGLGVRDVFAPEQNLTGGIQYVRQLMDQFGNIPDAVAAYNAGPGRVAGWIRAGRPAGGLPNETTAYVAKVLANAGGVSDQAPVGGNVGRAAIMPGGGFNDAGMGSGPGAMAPEPGYVGPGAPPYTGPPGAEGPPPMTPVQAPAPLPAALVGTGPLAQVANAAVTEPGPVAPDPLDVPEAPGFRYLRNRQGYKPAPGNKGEVLAVDQNGREIAVAYPGSIAVDAAKAAAIAAAKGGTRPLAETTRKNLEAGASTLDGLDRLNSSFKTDYSGFGSSTQNMVGRNAPDYLTSDGLQKQAAWWQQYETYANKIRNELFGSALSAGEQAAFERANITPGMNADIIRKNLNEQQRIIQAAQSRRAASLVAEGHNLESVAAASALPIEDINKARATIQGGGTIRTDSALGTSPRGSAPARTVTRTGTLPDGRRVTQYSDGTTEAR